MKITKLILTGFLRLSLRSIDRIEYTPKEKTQIILGSNGSGKSSLMKELSPLPAVPAEYRKGGSKEIWIEFRGKEYYLVSSFPAEGNLFEFYCDGVNLNPGRTVTVFKELVKEHFNYSAELHALMTGRVLFHELSVNDRRKLFMSMNNVDYTYAFQYFNRLKDRARDLQGTVTQLQKRLSSEIEGLLTPEQEIVVKREAEEMRGILESLLMSKEITSVDPRTIEHQRSASVELYNTLQCEITDAFARYERIASRKSLDELEAAYQTTSHQLTESRKELKIRYEQHLKIESELREFQVVDSLDFGKLKDEIEELTAKKTATSQLLEMDIPWIFTFDVHKPGYLLDMLSMSLTALQHCADELQPYSERAEVTDVTPSSYKKVADDLLMHEDIYRREAGMISYSKTQIDDMLKSKEQAEVSCPNCNHSWHLGYSLSKFQHLQNDLKVTQESYDRRTKEIERLRALKAEFDHYIQVRRTVTSTMEQYEALSPFWNYLAKENVFSKYPERFLHESTRLKQHLSALSMLDNCNKLLDEKLRLKAVYEAALNKNKGKLKEAFRELEETIQTVQQRVTTLTLMSSTLQEELSTMKEIYDLYGRFSHLQTEIKKLEQCTIETYLDGVLGDLINNLKTEIVQKERSVAQVSMKKAVIQNTEVSIQSYKDELRLVNMAIDALSPKTGLIAQGMSLFINTFIERVNRFIAKVWSYPLSLDTIKPEGDDEIDLDYKFIVNVNNTGSSPDIASTSSGMREIIHLACVITCMRFMGFEHHPVFLDEFAVKMDDAHRKAAYSIIEYLIDEANVSQVFLISHYENGYSSLSAADITVLCDANVSMPKHLTYNSCAIIS